jgi:hypothetical protein
MSHTEQCHQMSQGGRGPKIVQKKCHILFEWPLKFRVFFIRRHFFCSPGQCTNHGLPSTHYQLFVRRSDRLFILGGRGMVMFSVSQHSGLYKKLLLLWKYLRQSTKDLD